jgi:hypothetical protein
VYQVVVTLIKEKEEAGPTYFVDMKSMPEGS